MTQPQEHGGKNPRLAGYDYSSPGAYFVTIVTFQRELLLIDDAFRAVVERSWHWLKERYEYVALDEYVVMPNHLHGILIIEDSRMGRTATAPSITNPRRGRSGTAPPPPGRIKRLGSLIGAFKTVSTREINLLRSTPGTPVCQRNYYEHIIRGADELDGIRKYIADNPATWAEDPRNPEAIALAGSAGPFPNGPYGLA